MNRKKSQSTEITTLDASSYVPVFTDSEDFRIKKSNLFAQIDSEFGTFIYKSVAQLQAANLAADVTNPVYVRVEDNNYRLYKITANAAGTNDIVLANGKTAELQIPNDQEIDTFALLGSTKAKLNQIVTIKGHTTAGIGGGQFIAKAGSVTSDGGTQINSATGGLYWQRVDLRQVSTSWFGAIGDRTTSDYAAVQLTINYCLSFSVPKTLYTYGLHLITNSLIIDRVVDTTTANFRIVGDGMGGGFYTTGNVTIFDSSLTVTTDPRSEFVQFEGIQFESSTNTSTSYCFSQKFLRMKFIGCRFEKIRCIVSSIYTQSWHFIGVVIRNQNGHFFDTAGLYDVSFSSGFVSENNYGGRLVRCVSATRGCSGLRLVDGVIEGMQAGTIAITGANGVFIAGNHIESNGAQDFNSFAGVLTNKSITFSGNFIATANVANAVWYHGTTEQFVSCGNTVIDALATGVAKLHTNCSAVTDLISVGDSTTNLSDSTVTSRINGITRLGAAQTSWSNNLNEITKDTTGHFGFGFPSQASSRIFVAGEDTSATKYAATFSDSSGNTIIALRNDRYINIPLLGNYANDAAAAGGGVPVGYLYRNGSIVMVRVV